MKGLRVKGCKGFDKAVMLSEAKHLGPKHLEE